MINKKRCIYVFFLITMVASLSIRSANKTSSANMSTYLTPTVFVDESGHEMVFVPSGTFEFGISRNELEWFCENEMSNEIFESCIDYLGDYTGALNSYEVDVEGFWMDKYEVTVEQYQECVDFWRCESITIDYLRVSIDNPQYPQLGVTWYDAMLYCNRRGGRLPTEAEWEYAASGPDNLNFPWGNTYSEEYTAIDEESAGKTPYIVGSIPENQSWIGVYDMSANAAEWVEDRYLEHEISHPDRAVLDDYVRVIRGGSWDLRKFTLTAFWRDFESPWVPNHFVGFRCVSKRNLE